jgi:capsular exopolysaccharide synthesis family protein
VKSTTNIPDLQDIAVFKENPKGPQINFKRVADRVIRLWYVIVISVLVALAIAYIINRYTHRIYPIRASIIIKENEENAGAKFLYNNELLNPYRNFLNEIYIMRSYPLLQEVMESLGFEVSMYREGEIQTVEFYNPEFPVKFHVLHKRAGVGTSMYFRIKDEQTFSLQYVSQEKEHGKAFPSLAFNDTLQINGFKMLVERKGTIKQYIGQTFIIRFNDPVLLAKSYSARLNANWAAAGASVVNLEITGHVPRKEIDFLNKFIERYQFYDIEKKNTAATMALKFLDQQLLVIGDSLNEYENQVEAFKQKNVITSLEEETNRLYMKIKEFETQKFQYNLLDNYYKYITELLKRNSYDGIFTPSSVGITDNIVSGLVTSLISEQTQVNLYKSNAIEGAERLAENPVLQSKLKRIEFIKNDILKTIDNSRATRKINIDFINDQIKLVEAQLTKLPSTQRELIDIRRNYSLKESLYVFLLQKRTEAGLSRASTTSDIMLVNPPMAGGPIAPKVAQNYGIAAASGLLLPLLIFMMMELLNDKIQSREDIEKITSVPVIGGIGHNASVDQLVVHARPKSAMSESFRALRSNLNYFTANKDHLVFMVTSSVPGEGKSFTTLNLASVIAMAGKKTLIMGADLRRPKLFDDLGLNNDVGLSQYLSGMASQEQIIQKTKIDDLYLISGGPMPPNPSELLIRRAIDILMQDLRGKFDFIIIDTPPLSFVADAFVISKYVDHSIYVVRQNFTPNVALQTLEEFYQIGKLSNISVLFNDLSKSGFGYGYGGYGYGYGYGYTYGYSSNGKKKKEKEGSYYAD